MIGRTREPASMAQWRPSGPILDHSRVQRPNSRRLGFQPSVPSAPRLREDVEWRTWKELTVKVRGLQPSTTTWDIVRNFKKFGEIIFIEIFEGRSGVRQGDGKLRFSPAPREAFWARSKSGEYTMISEDGASSWNVYLSVEPQKRQFKIQSPIRKTVWYDENLTLFPSALNFGVMVDPTNMMRMQTVGASNRNDLTFVIDLLRNRLTASFKVHFQAQKDSASTAEAPSTTAVPRYDRVNRYMFQIPFSQLERIHRVNLDKDTMALIISVQSPPQFYRRREDEKSCHQAETFVWSEFDSWYRQTDIVYDPYALRTAVVALHKETPVIDIGRWTTYQFIIDVNKNEKSVYDMMKQALQDFNIEISTLDGVDHTPARPAELWNLIDTAAPQHHASALQHLEVDDSLVYLPFEVRYQLEVCISRDLLNEHNITKAFVVALSKLVSENPAKARTILEYVTEQDKRIFEPMTIFEDPEALNYSPRTTIPHYCAFSRKATITPSTIYFSSPTVETTNRVLRHYSRENQDGRFLRVQFTDEILEGRINSCADKQRNDELFTRVYRTLFNGIRIGDRHYEFLAFGNSQFRENGAYFFCPTDHLSCDDIRQWMGNFSHINVVAKYAARLGQCFSTTRAINGLSHPDIVKIPDVERNGFCFTDGVGKMSPFLANMITAELGLRVTQPPSAFQFRLGGCKGILVVWPDAKDKQVHIRKSQEKFAATYNGLEIIRWSRFSAASLNRQTITILSALGVSDEIFLKMLSEQLANYQAAMSDDSAALSLLSKYIDDNHVTLNIASMILNGFMSTREPFVISLLHLWRAWSIKLLKEKAKIIVEGGAFVLGCVDETATLKGYTTPSTNAGKSFLADELAEIFIQVPDRKDPTNKNPDYQVIEGVCLVGRNPSLHPGDLRVVRAVNVPVLHHLRDVVVFAQTGERDVPSMCSGGDLDGDDFFVIWDKDLQPPEWNCDPMDYQAPEPKKQRTVEVKDLMKFFVRFMKNDALPTIAHAHLASSDWLEIGVKDNRCLELAALHSKAVDYVKTGQPAEMPKRLRPQKWPHFMEKKHKPKSAVYNSTKILGQLYDKVDSVDFVPQWEMPFDRRILRAYKLEDSLLKKARQIKSQYDTAMRRIMAQQEIRTEFEVWSTFVLSKPRVGSDYKQGEIIGAITDALKDQFRLVCHEAAGGKDFEKLGPLVAAMYKVTKEELDIALSECRTMRVVGGREVPMRKMEPKLMPLITFPWLFEKELGRIATGIDASDDLDGLGLLPVKFGSKIDGITQRKGQGSGQNLAEFDFIEQEDGHVVHRGEELELFRRDSGEDEFLDDANDSDDSSLYRGERSLSKDKSEAAVLASEPQIPDSATSGLERKKSSGTGVEDVVPQAELDGLLNTGNCDVNQLLSSGDGGSPSPVKAAMGKMARDSVLSDFDLDVGMTSPSSLPSVATSADALAPSLADLKLFDEEPASQLPAVETKKVSQQEAEKKVAEELFDVSTVSSESKSYDTEEGAGHGDHRVAETADDQDEGVESDFEEVAVELDVKESALGKLSRLLG